MGEEAISGMLSIIAVIAIRRSGTIRDNATTKAWDRCAKALDKALGL